MPRRIQVFHSYCQTDKRYLSQLLEHTAPYVTVGHIEEWYDGHLTAGSAIDPTIDERISNADLITLLITPSYFASRYCFQVEMPKALAQAEAGRCRLLPVITKPCKWKRHLGSLLCVPSQGKAVSLWRNRDAAWVNVMDQFEKQIDEINGGLGSLESTELPTLAFSEPVRLRPTHKYKPNVGILTCDTVAELLATAESFSTNLANLLWILRGTHEHARYQKYVDRTTAARTLILDFLRAMTGTLAENHSVLNASSIREDVKAERAGPSSNIEGLIFLEVTRSVPLEFLLNCFKLRECLESIQASVRQFIQDYPSPANDLLIEAEVLTVSIDSIDATVAELSQMPFSPQVTAAS